MKASKPETILSAHWNSIVLTYIINLIWNRQDLGCVETSGLSVTACVTVRMIILHLCDLKVGGKNTFTRRLIYTCAPQGIMGAGPADQGMMGGNQGDMPAMKPPPAPPAVMLERRNQEVNIHKQKKRYILAK